MFIHDLRLALRSLRRNPILSALMIGAIAVGIAASMIAITLYHARAGHPIAWKEDTLFAVTLDTRDDEPPQSFQRHPEYPPFQVTYRDARALYASKIPVHAVMMYRSGQVLMPDNRSVKPFGVAIRVTTADFFTMFDVPFIYGTGWSRSEDAAPGAVVVLSKFMNQKLFGGANSVGREVLLDGHPYRVVGVMAAWMPQPKYYDLNSSGSFEIPEDIFMPFGWMQTRKMMPHGNINCVSRRAKIEGFDSLLTQDCVWLQYWVEFRNRSDRDRYQVFVDNYTNEERKHGRFPRRNNNRIVDVQTWLGMYDVVGEDSRMQLALGFVFLGVCVLNTLGLMLAKFLSAAPVSGLRRALGARRIDIVRQHLIEVIVVGLLGGAVGMALTLGGLAFLKVLMFSGMLAQSDNPDRVALVQSLVHMDMPVMAAAIAVSLLTGVLAGLYPAYRIGRLAPATFLKTQ
ncbi:MAG: transporter ATP-binding protein [Gammaproteobacteria bacterium]|nr:transporter ATP-binding protein [Gammaproteobacteria bacterium]